LNDLKLSLIEKGRLSTTLQFGEPKMIDVDVDAHEAELAALPKLTEDDDEMATLTQTISTLADSQTSVAYGDEGLAFDDSAFALDGNDEEDNDGEDDEVSRSQRTSSFSISLKMRDIPRFSVKIDASEAASLGRIMEDPTLCEKLGTMTEMEMRKTLDAEDSESTASSENDGIGSRRESVDDEDVDEDEEKTEEEDPEAKELIDAQIAGKLLERQGLAKARQSVTGQLGHRFSMAARPDVQSEHISSGMSSVFLKVWSMISLCCCTSMSQFLENENNSVRLDRDRDRDTHRLMKIAKSALWLLCLALYVALKCYQWHCLWRSKKHSQDTRCIARRCIHIGVRTTESRAERSD